MPEYPIRDGADYSPFSVLNLDVLKYICDVLAQISREDSAIKIFDGLSRTDHLMRVLCLPFLFRTVAVRGSWENASTKVEEMRRFSLIDEYIRTFKFDIFVADAEKHPPPVELAPALANLLTRMPKLEKLVLVIPEHHTNDFADAFARAKITLSGVHTLVVGTFCDFAVPLCHNVTTISNNGWSWLHTEAGKSSGQEHTRALIKAAGRAPKISNLQLMNWWTIDLVKAIHEALPYLPRLTLDGGSYQGGVATFIPLLSRFERLEFLALADACALGVGFTPPRCGNVYMGPHGKEVRKRVNDQRQQAEMRVAKMVAPACPVLKELWIGDQTRVEVVRDDDGSFKDVVFHRGRKREKVVHYPRP